MPRERQPVERDLERRNDADTDLELIREPGASEQVQKAYQDKARYGERLPDIHKAFAHDPEYLASTNEHMKRVLRPRKVDAKTKEVIAFVVAAMNGCDFCDRRTVARVDRSDPSSQ